MEDLGSLDMATKGITNLKRKKHKQQNKIQKTFVISRKTITNLKRTCKEYEAPRDLLVEQLIQRLIPLIDIEKKKHRKRKEIIKELESLFLDGSRVIEKSAKDLGQDDPVYERVESIIRNMQSNLQEIDSIIKKGEMIEEF